MGGSLRARVFHGANLLAAGCLAVLGVVLVLPGLSAARSSRIEHRGTILAECLLEAASAMQPVDLADPWTCEVVLARARALARSRGVPTNDLEGASPASSAASTAWFANKHYWFRIDPSPLDSRQPRPAPGHLPALELHAWPRDLTSAAHATCYVSEVAEPAFTRNLQAAYLDTGRAPPPGAGMRRNDNNNQRADAYRGTDDERWLTRRPRSEETAAQARAD